MTTQTDTMELEAGDLVEGKYRIGELIAEGGMGRLYRATQEPLGRSVAIKIIKLDGASDKKREKWQGRFFREASLAARLNHPHTVTVIDYGEYESVGLFLVMEYLDGISLRDALTHYGSLDVKLAVHIAVQIANSLADAHQAGIVHRDLKPPNVMLMRRGDDPCFVKVVDFGLVKELDPEKGSDELTGDNVLVGSPSYMAPERFMENDADSPAVDIYSLGIVMYEMLVGRAPFIRGEESTFGNVMIQHVNDDPPPMRSFAPDLELPEGLESLIMRCLAKKPSDRFESMETVLKLLRMCEASISTGSTSSEFESLEILSAPNTEDVPHIPPVQLNRQRTIAGIIALVVIGVGFGALLFFLRPAQRVQIVTNPGGAQIFDGDGLVVGVSPLVVKRELFPTSRIKLVQSGYETMEVDIPASEEKVVKLEYTLVPEQPTADEKSKEMKKPFDEPVEEPKEEPKEERKKPPKKTKPVDIKLSR